MCWVRIEHISVWSGHHMEHIYVWSDDGIEHIPVCLGGHIEHISVWLMTTIFEGCTMSGLPTSMGSPEVLVRISSVPDRTPSIFPLYVRLTAASSQK
jgi:hypothetical protein